MAGELKLRRAQAQKVMPLIGGLLDAWDAMPNDLKSDIEDSAASFSRHMEMINAAMEGLDTWNRRAQQEDRS